MDEMIFNFIKEEFEKDPILAENFIKKIGSAYCLKSFRNIPEALKALDEGKLIVGFSVTQKEGQLGVAFDNVYRIKNNILEIYKFTPNLTQRPFKMIPDRRMVIIGFAGDWREEIIGSLHHGFVLGDGSLVDLKNSRDFSGNKF